MNQYSPPLTLNKYSKVEGPNRRLLKETTESTKPNNTQPGLFAEQEHPDFQAEVNPDTNEAKINKNYSQQTDSKNGTTVQQDQQFNSQVSMKNGRMDESAQQSAMNMETPKDDPEENEQNWDGEADGETVKSATETKIYMKSMKVDNFSIFKFQKVQMLTEQELDQIYTDLSKNHLKNSTFEEF